MLSKIREGDTVIITDAWGEDVETRARSGVLGGGSRFPIVWVDRPLNDGGTEPAPWPASAVRLP